MTQVPIVYVITTGSLWPSKIGITEKNPNKRCSELQVGCWIKLHVFMAVEHHRNFMIESDIKKELKEKKLIGEWYDITAPEMVKEVIPLFNSYPNIPLTTKELLERSYEVNLREYYYEAEEDKKKQILKGLQIHVMQKYKIKQKPLEEEELREFLKWRAREEREIDQMLDDAVKAGLIGKLGDKWMPIPILHTSSTSSLLHMDIIRLPKRLE